MSVQTWARAYLAILLYVIILFSDSPHTSLLPGCSLGSVSQCMRPGWDFCLLRRDHQSQSLLKLEQSPHGRGPCLLKAAEWNGEAQMWDRAPGPFPAESEMEEGVEDEGSLSLPGLARSRWVSGPGRPRSPMSVSPFHGQGKPDSKVFPHTALHPNPSYPLNLTLRTRLSYTVWVPRD